MNHRNRAWLTVTAATLLAACSINFRPDVRVPIEDGNVARGQQTFIALQCHQCHTVAGVRLPEYPGEMPLEFELGGETTFIQSPGELMTSLMNPNHVISEEYRDQLRLEAGVPLGSPMPPIRDITVGQMLDLIAFLDSTYQLVVEDYESE